MALASRLSITSIFRVFERLQGTKFPGTGIGLSNCRRREQPVVVKSRDPTT
jgi:hypothetical protein